MLQAVLQRYYINGIATTTRSTYAAGQKLYTIFCSCTNRTTVPATEETLLLFVTYMITLNLSHATIKVYLSAVRHVHVTARLHSDFNQQLSPHLQQVLKGVKKTQAITEPSKGASAYHAIYHERYKALATAKTAVI